MSTGHLRRTLFLVLFWLATASWVQAQQGLTTEQFATQVAETLRDKRPDVVDKPIHWLFSVDTSGSMLGKSDAVNKMLRAFLTTTVVKGDRVSRVRFDSTLKTEGEPTELEVGSSEFSVDRVVNGLDPEKGSKETEGETIAAEARNYCQSFVSKVDPGYVRIALLLSDSGANDGKAIGTTGADATADWSGNVMADRDKSAKIVALYWVESGESTVLSAGTQVRKVAEKVEEEVSSARPVYDPDGAQRRAYQTVPWVLGSVSVVFVALSLLWPSSAKLRVSGQSAELKLPWYGSGVKASVNSGGPTFHLTRATQSSIVDGAGIVSFAIEEPYRIWQAPNVKVEGLNDSTSGVNFEVEVNGSGYDYRGRLRPGKNRISVRSGAGIVVREEPVELRDSGLRYVLIAIVTLVCLWLSLFIFGPTYEKSLRPISPAEPAQTKWVPRNLVI